MSTLATPSAKSHERVSGRWDYNVEIKTRRDQIVYYVKQIAGTPVPWFMLAFAVATCVSRAAQEMMSWAIALLTLVYIIGDRYSEKREFSFYRVGSDFFLLAFVLMGFLTALTADNFMDGLMQIGNLRWAFLLYAFTYCWDLFPGLNRVYFLLVGATVLTAGYCIWQHFTGLDPVSGQTLAYAPAPGQAYFIPTGFFGTSEIFGTLIAMVLPFIASAFALREKRDSLIEQILLITLALVCLVAVFLTYSPGIWFSTITGVLVAFLVKAKQVFRFVTAALVGFAILLFMLYPAPSKVFDEVAHVQETRAVKSRAQINAQVQLWESAPWIGTGAKVSQAQDYDPSTGNVYFMLLAQNGSIGGAFYLLFILSFMLSTYRIFGEIPPTHYWHRVLVAGGIGAQVAFHVAGLYWTTLNEALTLNFYIFVLASLAYLMEHYERGIVSDDSSI